MFLIVGLGNPGSEYNKTRHNVGFDVIDLISNKYNIPLNRKKFKGVYGNGDINNKKVILLKPETYMNLSGESVREVVDFYKISIENIIIVQDDISMELGKIRIRQKGSAGGHNGIKNIIAHLNTDKFTRIKIGVGEPKGDVVNYVLGKFSKEEMQTLEKTIDVSADAIDCIIEEGAYEAMNKFNGIAI